MNPPKHWQDPLNACVGVAILLSPFMANYAFVLPALANAMIVGTLLVTVWVGAAVIGRPWVECAVVALGAWLLASPWALALPDERSRDMALVLGSLVVLLGTSALAAERRSRQRVRGKLG